MTYHLTAFVAVVHVLHVIVHVAIHAIHVVVFNALVAGAWRFYTTNKTLTFSQV
jgi:hypothetical protein